MKNILLLGFSTLLSTTLAFSQAKESSEFVSADSDKGNVVQYISPEKVGENKPSKMSLDVGIGLVGISSFSQADKVAGVAGSSSTNFNPADFKIGFLHADAYITDKFMASFSLNLHTSANQKVSDMFFKYTPYDFLGVQVGRFKGAGNRAANETSAYDLDLADFAYIAETQNIDMGAPDLRHYGIDVFGKYKWMKYSFFWHKSNKDRTRYWSQVTNDVVPGNHGINMKSWDFSLRLTPLKNNEFGGHVGQMSRPGMGGKSKPVFSAFYYYEQPKRFKVKLDYVFHYRPIFDSAQKPAENDYTEFPWHAEKKQGISALAGFFANRHIEPVARFEHFYEGKNAAIGYEALNLYTLGFNYYPFPDSPRVGKFTVFYQKRDERNGIKLKNDWIGVQYQVVLFGKIFAK